MSRGMPVAFLRAGKSPNARLEEAPLINNNRLLSVAALGYSTLALIGAGVGPGR